MRKWKVKVSGDPADVEELATWFPVGESYAEQVEGSVLLVSNRFQEYMGPGDVARAAQIILDEWNPIISLQWKSYIPVGVEKIYEYTEQGTRIGHVLGAGTSTIRMKARVLHNPADGPTQAQQFWNKAQNDSRWSTILSIWGLPNRTWARLYRITEELDGIVGTGLVKAGLCEQAEYKRFQHSANHPEAAGPDSRHASGRGDAPKKPMSFDEADEFVRKVVVAALKRA